jgi:predicted GNAT family N-acyltransferase
VIKPFDCGTTDLNDFLFNDSKQYQEHLLTVTYFIENDTQTIAYYSLLNDKIQLQEEGEKRKWFKRVSEKLPHPKRRRSYPAMKIGRFAIDNNFRNKGLGLSMIDYIKMTFITNNRTGCRFISVDAKKESLGFYEKCGFEYLTETDKDKDARLMYYDLKRLT